MSARLFKGAGEHDFAPFIVPATITQEAAPEPPPVAHATPDDFYDEPPGHESESTLRQAAEEALQIVEAAQADAARIVAQAQARALEIEREARERGLAESRATHQAEVSQAVSELRDRLTTTIEEIAGLRAVVAAQAEHDLVRLALEIARKVIRREVSADPDIVIALARIALERLPSRVAAKVRISPEEFEYVTASSQQLGPDSTIELLADFAIKRGGCVVQGESGTIDARIEEQLAVIERGLLAG
ncbi:MAG: FliH/SctL family protein [Blastocatellia bacterium]